LLTRLRFLFFLKSGEQHLELKRAIPTSGRFTTSSRIANIYDKGKAALVVMESTTSDEKGEPVRIQHKQPFTAFLTFLSF
jgi:hypothetical protein